MNLYNGTLFENKRIAMGINSDCSVNAKGKPKKLGAEWNGGIVCGTYLVSRGCFRSGLFSSPVVSSHGPLCPTGDKYGEKNENENVNEQEFRGKLLVETARSVGREEKYSYWRRIRLKWLRYDEKGF